MPTRSLTIFFETLLATAVIHLSLLLIREHLVGRPKVLELLVGVRVIRVVVRMQLLGPTPVCLLDLVCVGITFNTKDRVEVSAGGIQFKHQHKSLNALSYTQLFVSVGVGGKGGALSYNAIFFLDGWADGYITSFFFPVEGGWGWGDHPHCFPVDLPLQCPQPIRIARLIKNIP